MFPISNSTISVIRNESTLGHQNSACVFVDSSAERISKLCAHSAISLGSLFGNIFVILIVYKNRDLRKTINYFIVNMAFSDLVLTLIVLPAEITRFVTDSLQWHVSGILGLICCKLFYFASYVSLLVSNPKLGVDSN